MKRDLSNIFMSLMLLTLVGCSFHLRASADLSDNLKIMYMQGINLNQSLSKKLRKALTRNGVTIVDSFQSGAAVFTVLEHEVERRVLSVDADAKVSEYELYGFMNYNISDGDGNIISEAQKVEVYRSYRFDQEQVLAKGEEEAALREELEKQLVQNILRRLSVLY